MLVASTIKRKDTEMNINTPVPILIKITNFKFAKRLRDGEIYMNPLAYFRGIEDGNVKGDLYEGTDSIIANDDIDKILPSLGSLDFILIGIVFVLIR